MNKKRQTVWLVSMLSLMVILSAYYLFSDDANNLDTAGDNETGGIVVDLLNQGANLEDILGSIDDVIADADQTLTDSEVLDIYNTQAMSGQEYFISLEMARENFYDQEIERLYYIANDSTKSDDEVKSAFAEIDVLEQQQLAIETIESQLTTQYDNAVVTRQSGEWKVVVQSEKLEKSEAVSILDLLMSELNIGPEHIKIAYMQ